MQKNKKPFLSVITPTYNRGDKLHFAFQSLLSQTNKDFEWIIVDDGSTDDTKRVVDKFIEKSDFKIIYKAIKHGGKHFATRAAYEIASGQYSLELDSDDELYDENTLDNLYHTVKVCQKNYPCIGGCFIDQNNQIFPKLDGEYLDLDKESYLNLFFDKNGIDTLNISWMMKMDYARSYLPPKIKDNLSYFPEAIINVNRVLKCKNFHLRVFNRPWYRYNMYNADSVTVNTFKTNAFWYYAKSLIETLNKYQLDDKYHDAFIQQCKNLFNYLPNNKTLRDNYMVFNNIGKPLLFAKFLSRYLLKNIFAVNHHTIVLCGVKIKLKKGD
ncbi:MAG: glycosyltransferase family 2 protein [Alphaproteobacteria bacterium]|nr:glycosyltransferase family 2 protein [Alphaproteobacteria bacterium]